MDQEQPGEARGEQEDLLSGRVGRVRRQENGETSSSDSKWAKDGEQEGQFLLLGRMDSQIPAEVQVAPSYLETCTRVALEEGEAEDGARTVEKNRVVLLRQLGEEQEDKRHSFFQAEERES